MTQSATPLEVAPRSYPSVPVGPELDVAVERLFRTGVLTTAGIATALGVAEAAVWNARAHMDARRRSA